MALSAAAAAFYAATSSSTIVAGWTSAATSIVGTANYMGIAMTINQAYVGMTGAVFASGWVCHSLTTSADIQNEVAIVLEGLNLLFDKEEFQALSLNDQVLAIRNAIRGKRDLAIWTARLNENFRDALLVVLTAVTNSRGEIPALLDKLESL